MSDLQAVLTARIDEEQAYVNRLHAEGATRDRRTHNLAVIVWRGLAEDRDIRRRHKIVEQMTLPATWYCEECDENLSAPHCAEIRSLARRHGIEVAAHG